MKKLFTTVLSIAMGISITSCSSVEQSKSIDLGSLTQQEIDNGVLTPEVLLKLRRLSGSQVSPDGKSIVYSLSIQDVDNNRSFSNLFVISMDDAKGVNITSTDKKHNSSPQWSADSKRIYYSTTTEAGENQVHAISPDGSNKVIITNVEGGINSFGISPNADKVWFTKNVKVDKTKADIYPNRPKSTAKIYDDLMVRHWDYWLDGTYSHLFVADVKSDKLENIVDITEGEAWDTPMAPYFPASSIVWNNNGTQIAYTSKKIPSGVEYSGSTNSDIYLYDLKTKSTKNLTKGMLGFDQFPTFSQDDSMVAWWSMERPGNEADKRRLFVIDLNTGAKKYLTKEFDYNASDMTFDGRDIYFISPIKATHQVCKVSVDGGDVEVLTNGDHDITSVSVQPESLIVEKMSLTNPTEIFTINRKSGQWNQISAINNDILADIKMGEVQKRWVKTTDGKDMLVWVTLPPNFDENKKYPTLLFCQGGPQGVVGCDWSYRWNYQLMAANGYVVVAPNRRGLPSFGQEWLDQISGDYSGQNIKDYLSAIDDVAKEPWSDEERLGAVGASYGGYSVFYLASQHDKRFKAFISHCGMFNFESFYGSTEELWFPNNDLGGPYWTKKDKTIKRSFANSPHNFVDKWNTPILIITGEQDFRIPYTQSLEAYTAARLNGVDARLISFEDEAHQVFKPQNSLVWHGEFFRWLDTYLK